VVSQNEVNLAKAEMDEAEAKAKFAAAELNFTEVRAPFDGIVDRLLLREGSLVKDGDVLTTLADNSTMWVYFNVPEKYYLHYMATKKERETDDKIELVLANGDVFPEQGKIGAIEADFNNQNGNIKFRADFPNPNGLLRHGQTGTIKILRPLKNVMVIPQRATFEILDKRYVWVVGEDNIAHQTLITVKYELEDIFVIDSGLTVTDKIVLEGVREVEDGFKVEYTFVSPEEALKHQKFHAE
jgi:membrane fusion protein (multidrug efflux system)